MSAPEWKVHVTVRGDDAGDYKHATFEAAKQMADERNAKFGVLGCHYRIVAPANECTSCGKPGIHIRTRYFKDENAEVWECETVGCPNHGLIWHTASARALPSHSVTVPSVSP